MSAFKVVRGIVRAFIKRLPEVRSGPGQVGSKSEQFIQQGDKFLTTRQQSTCYLHSGQSQSSLATFSKSVFDSIAGRRGHIWTSQAAQLRRRAVAHLLRNSGPRVPLFAFLGFAYTNNLAKPPADVEEQENLQELHQWIQKAFKVSNDNSSQPIEKENIIHQGLKLKDYKMTERLGERSSNSAVYAARYDGAEFAVKMLFNYGAQSHSASLYRAFAKEHEVLSVNTTKDMALQVPVHGDENEGSHARSTYTKLPPHENIVPVLHTFADEVPFLHDAVDSYPAALPSRYHPGGFGRNRSLFLVMPRYHRTVRQFLTEHTSPDPMISTLLLLQLLEGISHMTQHGVAHRDLKTDNLLLDETTAGCPRLVICDFGCCLADIRLGLSLPYLTNETDKGGNVQLMAPEVSSATPGDREVIDYSKSDAWAAGAIAYELFGETNPFYLPNLDSRTYREEDIPALSRASPSMRKVVALLLKRDPSERISASQAVSMLHTTLWMPSDWLTNRVKQSDVTKWLLRLTLLNFVEMRATSQMPLRQRVLQKFLRQTSTKDITEALEILRATDECCDVANTEGDQ